MLTVEHVHKRYGERVAVDDVSLEVKAGECVGLLGPNGAGKTTTVSLIAGLLRPDRGQVAFDGAPFTGDDDRRKRQLGLVPQETAIYEELSARRNLALFAGLYGLTGSAARTAIDEALVTVGLADRADERARNMSGGMKRRLNLAAALLGSPRLLLLDEPTVGVDPQSRNAIFETIERLKARGVALLYTTHYMEEAERLCERAVIIDHGRVIASGTLKALYDQVEVRSAMRVELERPPADPEQLLGGLKALPGVTAASLVHERVDVAVLTLDAAPAILGWLDAHGHAYTHFSSERANLELVYLTLTGRERADAR